MEFIEKFPDEFVFEQKFLLHDYVFKHLFDDLPGRFTGYLNVIPVTNDNFLNGSDCIKFQGKYYLRTAVEFSGYLIMSASCEAWCTAYTYSMLCRSRSLHYERIKNLKFGFTISNMKLFDEHTVFCAGGGSV